jgi:uncharacterized protein YukE
MDAAAVVALIAALVAVLAAAATVHLLRRAHARTRTLDEELERGKAMFDATVAREAEQRSDELAQTLKLARAESLSVLVEEERRITDERRRDVAERERDASARLLQALAEAERRVDERLTVWVADLGRLQESLAAELAGIPQRVAQVAADAEAKISDEAERLQSAIDEHRALIGRLREELDRTAQDVAQNANAELEQHASDRRRALQEVADRLRRREHELQQEIDHELAEATQRIGSQIGDIEQRQIEQLRRAVAREGARHAEAAAQQFEATFRTAREEAAKRLGRELDLAVERFARQAEGVLAERIEHLAANAVQRVDARLEELSRRLDELGARI